MKAGREAQIAIIEDNLSLQEELVFFLESKGFAVWATHSAEVFWKRLHAAPVDIVLVDIGLPGEDGFSVLEYLRGLGPYGLVVMSARGAQADRARGLSLGADAYLVKPVNFADLAMTLVQLWQRLKQHKEQGGAVDSNTSETETWALRDLRLLSPQGRTLSLTEQETRLLETLMRYPNEVCDKTYLHEHLFGFHDEPDTHRIDVVLSRLRNKARKAQFPLPIRVVFGKGIVFLVD
ncbi:MAG: two-component system response regulator [Pusillimonas sp.]|nr:two-component system response regulator [Pusillimonas sp.]